MSQSLTRRIPDALTLALQLLREADVEDPMRDARRLLAHAIGQPLDRLTLFMQDEMSEATAATFAELIARRAKREPVSNITGIKAFYGRTFIVGPSVLSPRPETEALVESALSLPFRCVLDLGTGSGCILLTLLAERPDVLLGVGIDLSPDALGTAARNRDAFGLASKATLGQGDWYQGLRDAVPEHQRRFDLIVSNPPYIAADEMEQLQPEVRYFEPRVALTDEADGLRAYRAIAAGALEHLTRGGRLLVEIGPTQAEAVTSIFSAAGLESMDVLPDLDGRDRVVLARAPAA